MTAASIKPLSREAQQTLIEEARQAATRAYAPYSGFRVGAAVRSASGEIFHGANVENASYGLTLCAERVALSAARMGTDDPLVAIAVACVDAEPGSPLSLRSPCGACRQWIHELAPDAEVLIADTDGACQIFRANDLLPMAFSLRD